MAKRKRTIEIYFILYLAALTLLITEKSYITPESKDGSPVFTLPFSINTEKSVLTANIKKDTSGPSILDIDSINTIYYTGNLKNIRYDFSVVNQSRGGTVNISSQNNPTTKYFRIKENKDKSVDFYWQPPLFEVEDNTYIVYITATGEHSGESGSSKTVEVTTQFSLVVNVVNDRSGIGDFALGDSLNLVRDSAAIEEITKRLLANQRFTGEMRIQPLSYQVSAIAYRSWSNQIFVSGLNPQTGLAKEPEIEITHNPAGNGGTASITSYYENYIQMSGHAPGYGSMKVKLILTRRSDRSEIETEFLVETAPIGYPVYPEKMFPEITYKFDPKLPQAGTLKVSAKLTYDGNTVAESASGEPFYFRPVLSDTGKTIVFSRYVNGSLITPEFKIDIEDTPPPEIASLQLITPEIIYIETIAYGKSGGNGNAVEKLEIISGNAKYTDKRGKMTFDADRNIVSQVFEITPRQPEIPFTFKVRAIDSRGRKSNIREFPSN